jgi:hypothetical protein
MRTNWIRLGTTTMVIVIAGSSSAFACPVCFGAEETSVVEGMQLGVFALLAVTLAVQGGCAGFFLYLRRRMKRIADLDLDNEWLKLQGGAPRS